MKKYITILIFSLNLLNADNLELDRYSEHFHLKMSLNDSPISEVLLSLAEGLYSELKFDFQHEFNQKIEINLYPDLDSHHEALGLKNAPSWLVARTNDRQIDIVSPLNPGPYHSKESLLKIFQLNIVKTFINHKFGKNSVPFWLEFGTAATKVNYSSKLPEIIPSLDDLEDFSRWEAINGFGCAHFFVSYLNDQYGWEKLLSLFEQYPDFESVYGKSKSALYQEWSDSLF